MERHGRTHTALSWMDARRNDVFVCSAFVGCSVLSNSFERVAIGRDFEHRIPRDSHIAVNPFPVVQLDDCFTRDEFALRVDDLPFSNRRVDSSPKFIALITFFLPVSLRESLE